MTFDKILRESIIKAQCLKDKRNPVSNSTRDIKKI